MTNDFGGFDSNKAKKLYAMRFKRWSPGRIVKIEAPSWFDARIELYRQYVVESSLGLIVEGQEIEGK